MSVEEIYAYIAGFFDGEGSPCLTHRYNPEKHYSRKISVRLSIPNTDKETLESMRRDIGNIGTITARKKMKSHWKQCWEWHIGSYKQILDFSLKVSPYIRNNKKQAKFDILIKYCRLRMSKLEKYYGSNFEARFSDDEYELVKEFLEVGC